MKAAQDAAKQAQSERRKVIGAFSKAEEPVGSCGNWSEEAGAVKDRTEDCETGREDSGMTGVEPSFGLDPRPGAVGLAVR